MIEKHGAVYDKEYDRLLAPTLKHYRIENWQADKAALEGVKGNWPL